MLRIYLFGPPRLLLDELPIPVGGRPKVWPLLAYLVLHARSALSRDLVARTFWPDQSAGDARANLRRHLHYLGALLPAPAPQTPWVTATTAVVAWNRDSGAWCDAWEFERSEREPARFVRAVELYAGDLLEGCDEPWVVAQREAYRVTYLRLLEQLAFAYLARREFSSAERYAQALLLGDPWRETAVRALMRIRFEAGDRAGALAAYERFAARLREELATLPMPDTELAYQALLDDRPPPGVIADAGRADSAPVSTNRWAGDLPFVGRRREIDVLGELGRRAARGQGATVAISGEAGIGKSRLVREAALHFEAAGGCVFAGATASPESISYQPLVEILRTAAPLAPHLGVAQIWLAALAPLVPELTAMTEAGAAGFEPGRERTRLFEACAIFLSAVAARRPLMIVLEDIHWAGGATIALVEHLARRLRPEKALILVTYREEELARTHPLRDLRRRSEREQIVTQLPLGRLSLSDVTQLVRSLDAEAEADADAIARRLHVQSDGNPFFLSELVRNVRERGAVEVAGSAPPRLRQTIENRLGRLPEDAREIVSIAAVLGSRFDIELLAETTGRPEADLYASLDELVDRRLLVERTVGGRFGYAFAHQLVAATIYDGFGTTWLRHQHRRVATVLQDLAGNGRTEPVAQIARHWDRAGDFERAAQAYVKAASDAFGVTAYEDGQRFAARALELTTIAQLRFDALLLSEGAASVSGDRELQAARLDELELVTATLDNDDATLNVRSLRLAWLHLRNDRDREERLIRELKIAADHKGSSTWRAAALEAEVRMCRSSGQFDRARSAFDRLIATIAGGGNQRRYTAAYVARADVDIYQGRFEEAKASLEALRALVAQTGDRPALVRALMTFARSALARQAYAEMSGYAYEAHRLSCEIGDREGEALALHTIANGHVYPFRVAEARAAYRQASVIYDAIGHGIGQASVAIDEGLFHTETGLFTRAFELYERADAIGTEIAFAWGRCVVRINKAYALRLSGAAAEAAAVASEALVLAATMGSAQLESAALGTLGAAESDLGRLEPAIGHLRRGVELRRSAGPTPRLGDNLCALALALLRANEPAAASVVSAELILLHSAHPDLAPQPTEWLAVAAQIATANGDTRNAALLSADAIAAFRKRLARIDDDAMRNAFTALPFNRALAGTPTRS